MRRSQLPLIAIRRSQRVSLIRVDGRCELNVSPLDRRICHNCTSNTVGTTGFEPATP